MPEKVWGYHLILNIAECNNGVTKRDCIAEFSKDLLEAVEMVPYGDPIIEHFAEHIPEAAGYSLVQLLMTSALTGHFSDRDLTAYLDIFSCKSFEEEKAIAVVKKHFAPKTIQKIFLKRDALIMQAPFIPADNDQKRLGECNGCGACCFSDAIIIREEGISDWMDLHGLDYPMQAEKPITVLFKKIDPNTISLSLFEKCKNTVKAEGEKIICGDYENRPKKCRVFPQRKEQIAYIPQCSFEFRRGFKERREESNSLLGS